VVYILALHEGMLVALCGVIVPPAFVDGQGRPGSARDPLRPCGGRIRRGGRWHNGGAAGFAGGIVLVERAGRGPRLGGGGLLWGRVGGSVGVIRIGFGVDAIGSWDRTGRIHLRGGTDVRSGGDGELVMPSRSCQLSPVDFMSSGEAVVPSLTSGRRRPEHSAPHGGVFLPNIARLEDVNTEELVQDWAPLPDIAELTGLSISQVRRLLEDGAICGIKIGEPKVLQVPLAFFVDGEVVKPLKGTLSTLHDAGFDDE